MRRADRKEPPIKLAVLALSISHFEVPLFRLCAQCEGLQFKVFYINPVKENTYDAEYGLKIKWGGNLLAGYESEKVDNAKELKGAAIEWGADVVMIYGYGWTGAAQIILSNWWKRRAQIHRGTLNYYYDPRRPIRSRIMRPLGRILLRLFNAHHYGGDYSRKVLLDAGIKESDLFFVPYSVDTPHFLAASQQAEKHNAGMAIRRQLGWGVDDHVILYIAQHNWFKGPDIAMDVFRQVAGTNPRARFLVVGSGRMTDAMKSDAQRYIDKKIIHFTGFVPSTKTVDYYLASDLVLCTSRYETWARMVNEAMLCKRPCLVSRVVPAAGGLIVHGKNGYIVDSPKASQFVPVIERHFSLPLNERQKMGNAACEKAREFSYETHISNVLAAARYALNRCKRSRTTLYIL